MIELDARNGNVHLAKLGEMCIYKKISGVAAQYAFYLEPLAITNMHSGAEVMKLMAPVRNGDMTEMLPVSTDLLMLIRILDIFSSI